jgi:hypothetical protein
VKQRLAVLPGERLKVRSVRADAAEDFAKQHRHRDRAGQRNGVISKASLYQRNGREA